MYLCITTAMNSPNYFCMITAVLQAALLLARVKALLGLLLGPHQKPALISDYALLLMSGSQHLLYGLASFTLSDLLPQ